MITRIDELEKKMDPIIKQIIFDLRPEGKINNQLFSELYSKLNDYKEMLKGAEHINRSIAGKLFYLYSTMIVEAKYKDFENNIIDELLRFRIYLLNVYDDRILD